jgi:hypothetical protein
LTYSVYRPDLAALGASDGLMASGLCRSSNDSLTRRDLGLEFLDVTSRLLLSPPRVQNDPWNRAHVHRLKLSNTSGEVVDTDLIVCFKGLPRGVKVIGAEGLTRETPESGLPYLRFRLPGGEIPPGASFNFVAVFYAPPNTKISYTLVVLSGQGKP